MMALKAPRKKFVILVVLLTGVFFFLLLDLRGALRYLLPGDQITRRVIRILDQRLAVETGISEVRLKLFPRPAAEALGVELKDPKTGIPWVHADSVEIDLEILPLLRGRVIPSKVLLKRPRVAVFKDSRNGWRFPGLSPILPGKRDVPLSSFLPPSIDAIVIQEASLAIVDPTRVDRVPFTLVEKTNAVFRGDFTGGVVRMKIRGSFPRDRRFERRFFSLRGDLSVPGEGLELRKVTGSADLKVSSMPARVLHPFLDRFSAFFPDTGKVDLKVHALLHPDAVLDLSGRFSLGHFRIRAPAYYSRPIQGKRASVDFVLNVRRDLVNAKAIRLNLGEGSLWGHGIYARNLHGRPWFGLTLHADRLTLDTVRPFLPDRFLWEKAGRILRRGTSTGSLDIPLLEVTGAPAGRKGKTPAKGPRSIILKLRFHDFSFNSGSEILPIRDINGDLTFDLKTLRFRGLNGAYGRSELKRIDGILALDPGGRTDLSVNGRLNLEEIGRLSTWIPDRVRGKLLPTFLDHARGTADTRLRFVSGGAPETPVAVRGEVVLLNVSLTPPWIHLPISSINGILKLQDGQLLPFILSARIHQTPVEIQGKIQRLFARDREIHLRFSATPDPEMIFSWASFLKTNLRMEEGKPDLVLSLDGGTDALKLSCRLDLTRTRVTFAPWLAKKAGVKARLSFSGELPEGGTLKIDRGLWEMSGVSVPFSVHVAGWKHPEFSLAFVSEGLSLSSLSGVFPVLAPVSREALLKGRLTLSFRSGRGEPVLFQGRVFLEGAAIHPSFSPLPFRNIAGTLLFQDRGLQARGIGCDWGDVPLVLDLSVPDLYNPKPDLKIHASLLDVKRLLQVLSTKRRKQAGSSLRQRPSKNANASGELFLDRARFGQVRVDGFHASFRLKDGFLSVPSFTASGLDGKVSGAGSIDFASRERPFFTAEARVQGVSAEKYLQLFQNNRTFYAGKITGSISVRGDLYPDILTTGRKMTGKAHLKIRSTRERFYLFKLFKEIIQRIEIMIGEKDELFRILVYDTMGGDFTIHDGKFHSRNFYITQYHKFDVSGLTLDKLTAAVPIKIKYNVKAAGSYDFIDSSVYAYIAAQPFPIANKILRKVPLAGKILTGKDRSLYSMYFTYQGLTSYKSYGTGKHAEVRRISFKSLPEEMKRILKGSDQTPGG